MVMKINIGAMHSEKGRLKNNVASRESIVLEVMKVVTPKLEVQQVDVSLPTHKQQAFLAKKAIFIST